MFTSKAWSSWMHFIIGSDCWTTVMRGITIPNNASKATIVIHHVNSVFADKSDQDAALSKLNQPICDVQVGENIDPVCWMSL
jgi:hypothetical protein